MSKTWSKPPTNPPSRTNATGQAGSSAEDPASSGELAAPSCLAVGAVLAGDDPSGRAMLGWPGGRSFSRWRRGDAPTLEGVGWQSEVLYLQNAGRARRKADDQVNEEHAGGLVVEEVESSNLSPLASRNRPYRAAPSCSWRLRGQPSGPMDAAKGALPNGVRFGA